MILYRAPSILAAVVASDGSAARKFGAGIVGGHPGGSPPVRHLDGPDGRSGGHKIGGHAYPSRVSLEHALEPGRHCHGPEAVERGRP